MRYSQSAKLKRLQERQYGLNPKNVCKYCFSGCYKVDQYEETSHYVQKYSVHVLGTFPNIGFTALRTRIFLHNISAHKIRNAVLVIKKATIRIITRERNERSSY